MRSGATPPIFISGQGVGKRCPVLILLHCLVVHWESRVNTLSQISADFRIAKSCVVVSCVPIRVLPVRPTASWRIAYVHRGFLMSMRNLISTVCLFWRSLSTGIVVCDDDRSGGGGCGGSSVLEYLFIFCALGSGKETPLSLAPALEPLQDNGPLSASWHCLNRTRPKFKRNSSNSPDSGVRIDLKCLMSTLFTGIETCNDSCLDGVWNPCKALQRLLQIFCACAKTHMKRVCDK